VERRDHRQMPPPSRLTSRPASSTEDVETLRLIRNSCREFMTRDQRAITRAGQQAWWQDRDPETVRCYVFEIAGLAAGYGLIRLEDGPGGEGRAAWLSGGLRPVYRGRGLGRPLFQQLIALAPEQPWLEVLVDNERAIRLYTSLGFRVISRSETALTLTLEPRWAA
jgi:ribosomal protein S18 acetylase RimI-like enzyme